MSCEIFRTRMNEQADLREHYVILNGQLSSVKAKLNILCNRLKQIEAILNGIIIGDVALGNGNITGIRTKLEGYLAGLDTLINEGRNERAKADAEYKNALKQYTACTQAENSSAVSSQKIQKKLEH